MEVNPTNENLEIDRNSFFHLLLSSYREQSFLLLVNPSFFLLYSPTVSSTPFSRNETSQHSPLPAIQRLGVGLELVNVSLWARSTPFSSTVRVSLKSHPLTPISPTVFDYIPSFLPRGIQLQLPLLEELRVPDCPLTRDLPLCQVRDTTPTNKSFVSYASSD